MDKLLVMYKLSHTACLVVIGWALMNLSPNQDTSWVWLAIVGVPEILAWCYLASPTSVWGSRMARLMIIFGTPPLHLFVLWAMVRQVEMLM